MDAAEPEANWGYLLSKYGVEISENALDYGGVLFHRVEHGSFLQDPAYEKMMTYVPREARHYYEGTARDIDAQHKKLMAISRRSRLRISASTARRRRERRIFFCLYRSERLWRKPATGSSIRPCWQMWTGGI